MTTATSTPTYTTPAELRAAFHLDTPAYCNRAFCDLVNAQFAALEAAHGAEAGDYAHYAQPTPSRLSLAVLAGLRKAAPVLALLLTLWTLAAVMVG